MSTEVVRAFSEENLSSLMMKVSDQYGQIIDYLGLLLISAEDNEKDRQDLKTKVIEIQQSTMEIQQSAQMINSKLDTVLEKLASMEKAFADIKSEQRDIDQKLMLMMVKLQKIENSIPEEDLEEYRELAKSLYTNWDALEVFTKKYIPLAEYLYSKLQRINGADYSPVILELCRAIENEFLLKIFSKYTMDLLLRKSRNLDTFLAVDKSDASLIKKTQQFVKAITRASRTRKPEYTLGQMNAILSMLKEADTVSSSPLLRDFELYLQTNTEATRLLDADYIQKVNDIVNKYRNPSAHPDFMSIQKANECREVMPDRIDYLVECVG